LISANHHYHYNDDKKDIDQLYSEAVQSCFYDEDFTKRNKDIQTKHIGTKGIVKEV